MKGNVQVPCWLSYLSCLVPQPFYLKKHTEVYNNYKRVALLPQASY